MKRDSEHATVLVTGGAARLGAAIVRRLASDGWQILLHYGRSETPAQALADEIRAQGGRCHPVQAHLTEAGEAERLFETALRHCNRVDALINNAAMFPEEDRFGRLSTDEQARLMQLNLYSPLALIQALAEQPSLDSGSVVNLLDARLYRPGTDHFHYRLAKGGLLQATRNLALELAPRIRVNGVAPGAILPPPGKDSAWLAAQKTGCIPLQRTGSAGDIAQAVAFLLAAPFVTGQVLAVDGGEFLA